MKQFWLSSCKDLSAQRGEFYSGARKIHRRVTLVSAGSPFDKAPLLTMADCGFTKSKTSMLMRNYYLAESIAAAKTLWDKRKEQDKYGSVGFSCYGHFMKGNVKGATKRGSVMGPCIQGVTLTLNNHGETSVDVFYRTTELFKKFPADLVFLRENLLSNFSFKEAPIVDVAFHFANVTCHPMYAVTFMPHLRDPIAWLDSLKKKDKYFYDWVVKWSARYLCEEYSRGILKFSQALRVRQDALSRIDKATLKALQKYLRKNHPGYRNDGVKDEEEEE